MPALRSSDNSLRSALALFVICLGAITAALDSAVNIAFPSITDYFGRELQDISWLVIAYVLTYCSLLLIFGRLGDLVGYRIVFQIGLVISTVGFAACAYAETFVVLLLGRIVQGIGIALILSCAPALITSLRGEQERTRMLGIYASMAAIGAALGPLAGGMMVERFGWSVVFWVRIPLVLTALALSWCIPVRRASGSLTGLDPLGSVQLVFALCAVLLGFAVHRDSTGPTLPLAMIALGCLVLALFIRRQSARSNPIIRPALFREPLFLLMNGASVIANFAAFSVVLIGPFYLIRVARLDAGLAGLMLACGAFGLIVGSLCAAGIISRIGRSRTAVLGMFLSAAGLLGISIWTDEVQFSLMVLTLFLQGFGLGLFQVAYADLVTATLPVTERGVAGSLTMVTRTIGIVGGAAGHAALHSYFETAATASGGAGIASFLAGFQAVFVVAATAQFLALVVGGLVIWKSGKRTAKDA